MGASAQGSTERGKRRRSALSPYVEYWERTVPWTFKAEKLSYQERRRLRYSLQDYMSEAIPFGSFKGKRVLELGSGSGIDSAEFGINGAEVVALDFTKTGARKTLSTLAEAGVRSSDVVRAAAQRLPFRDGAFACVYSFGVVHHIPDARAVVREVSRLLTAGGSFICMVYNKESLLYAYSILFLHRARRLREDQLVSIYSERVEGCPYTKAYTQAQVREILADDFEHVQLGVHFNVIDLPQQRKVKLGISDEYQLGWHIVSIATKRTRK